MADADIQHYKDLMARYFDDNEDLKKERDEYRFLYEDMKRQKEEIFATLEDYKFACEQLTDNLEKARKKNKNKERLINKLYKQNTKLRRELKGECEEDDG